MGQAPQPEALRGNQQFLDLEGIMDGPHRQPDSQPIQDFGLPWHQVRGLPAAQGFRREQDRLRPAVRHGPQARQGFGQEMAEMKEQRASVEMTARKPARIFRGRAPPAAVITLAPLKGRLDPQAPPVEHRPVFGVDAGIRDAPDVVRIAVRAGQAVHQASVPRRSAIIRA